MRELFRMENLQDLVQAISGLQGQQPAKYKEVI